jgi:predicted transcriptional regulator
MPGEDAKMLAKTMEEIDLMERHLEMLKVTMKYQPVGIIRLSEILDMPKHKVRYSLRLLEQNGLIVATTEGAMVTDKYDQFMIELSTYLDRLEKRISEVRAEIPLTSDNN